MSSLKQTLINTVDDNNPLPTHEALYHWIADHPDYADLLERAKNNTPPPAVSPAQVRLTWVKNLFVANPDEFYGRAYVTKELVEHSKITARVVSWSGLVDLVTNYSIFYLAFRGMGPVLAPVFGLLVDVLLLKFGNDCAAGASGHKPNLRPWARAGLLGLIGINVIRTLVSGVGTEMMLNAPAISNLKAEALIVEQEQKIESIKSLSDPMQQKLQEDCTTGQAELKTMPTSDPNRASLYVRLYGTWGQTQKDWSQVPEGSLPICPRADRLQADALKSYAQAKADWEALKLQRLKVGNDVAFLQSALPNLYQAHFEANGEMKSGVEAIGFAAKNLQRKATWDDWAELILPVFFMLISTATSYTACKMTLTHARRPDTQRSRNSAVEQERDRWLEQQYQAISSTRRSNRHP